MWVLNIYISLYILIFFLTRRRRIDKNIYIRKKHFHKINILLFLQLNTKFQRIGIMNLMIQLEIQGAKTFPWIESSWCDKKGLQKKKRSCSSMSAWNLKLIRIKPLENAWFSLSCKIWMKKKTLLRTTHL